MNARQMILKNLENRAYPVNGFVALSGLTAEEGMRELEIMQRAGLIEVKDMIRGGGIPMYRLSYNGRQLAKGPQLVVDNNAILV